MKKTILCFSRSYLAYLMPEFEKRDPDHNYLYIVQTTNESNVVKAKGGNVVCNIETLIKDKIRNNQVTWSEPNDFRDITNFHYSPIYSDRFLINFSPAKRDLIAGSLFEEFQKIFSKYKIDFFLGEPVALFTTHLLFYLTKKHGGSARLWSGTFFPDHFLFSENLLMSKAIGLRNEKTKDEIDGLRESISIYLNGIVEDKKGPAYHYSFAVKRSKLDTFLKTRQGTSPIVVSPGIVSIALQFLRYSRAKAYNLLFPIIGDYQTAASHKEHWFYLKCLLTPKNLYDKIPSEYSVDNVMFPIQFEPEATLLYFSPDFSDQYVVVENIAKSLPHDKTLYVKEHPNQFGYLGQKRWQELRKKFHNIKFIYGRESGRSLIKMVNFVTCISSSAGMDALLFGKRVVLVGDVYYQNFTGALKVGSYKELNMVLNKESTYLYKGHTIEDNLDNFMAIANKSHLGFPYSSQNLFDNKNLKNIVAAIRREFT